jgi:hypothetical protein
MKLSALNVFVYLMLACCQSALAADVYRCGNTYQDSPCKTEVSKPINQKPVNNDAAPASNKVSTSKTQIPPAANADCKLRGEAAKSIVKMREAGKTEDELKASATDSYTAALVKDVYKHQGTAFQVQNSIERECVQQLQKASLTSKWMAEAKRLLGAGTVTKDSANHSTKPQATSPAQTATTARAAPPAASPAQPATGTTPAPVTSPAPTKPIPTAPPTQQEPVRAEPIAKPEPPAAVTNPPPQEIAPAAEPTPVAEPTPIAQKDEPEEDTLGMCKALKAGLANIASQKRKGGSAALMKDLKEQQIELENVMKSGGC